MNQDNSQQPKEEPKQVSTQNTGRPVAPDGYIPKHPPVQQPQDKVPSKGQSTPGAQIKDFDKPHRGHPLSAARGIVSFTGVFLLFILMQFGALFSSFSEAERVPALVIMLVIGLIILSFIGLTAVGTYLGWRARTWQLTDEGLRLRAGIIFKKDLTIPYERINAVNTNADIFNRILGLSNLQVETAADASTADTVIRGIKRADAERVKQEIFKRRQKALKEEGANLGSSVQVTDGGEQVITDPLVAKALGVEVGDAVPQKLQKAIADENQEQIAATDESKDLSHMLASANEMFRGVFAEDSIEDDPVEASHTLSTKELALVGIANASMGPIILTIIGVIAQLPGIGYALISEELNQVSLLLLANLPIVSIALIGAALFIWIISVLGSIVGYGGFTVKKRGERLEISQGLLTQRIHMIDLKRVQYIQIKRGFIKKLIGYATVTVGTIQSGSVGGDQSEDSINMGVTAHPFIKFDQVDDFINSFMPEYKEYNQVPVEKLPPIATRRAINRTLIRWLPVALVIIAFLASYLTPSVKELFLDIGATSQGSAWLKVGIAIPLVILVIAFVITIVMAVLNVRHTRVGHDEFRYIITNGALGRKTQIVHRTKIQSLELTQNPFQRMRSVYTILMKTAVANGISDPGVRDLSHEQASDLVDWVYSSQDNVERAKKALREAGLDY